MVEAFMEGYMLKAALRTRDADTNQPGQTRLNPEAPTLGSGAIAPSRPPQVPLPGAQGSTGEAQFTGLPGETQAAAHSRRKAKQQAIAAQKATASTSTTATGTEEKPRGLLGSVGDAFGSAVGDLIPESKKQQMKQQEIDKIRANPDKYLLPQLQSMGDDVFEVNENNKQTFEFFKEKAINHITKNPKEAASMAVAAMKNKGFLTNLMKDPQVRKWAGMAAIPIGGLALMLFWQMMKRRRSQQQQQAPAQQQPYAWRL